MEELVKVTTNPQGGQVVSARELYESLGFTKSQWKRWYRKNIEKNPFAIEGTDWVGFDIMSSSNNGLPTKDFALSINFAKKISMVARTEQGDKVRDYFVACEEKLLTLSAREQKRRAKLAKQGKDQLFIETRIKSVNTRNAFTAMLAKHGVGNEGYRNCTNAIYTPFYGGSTNVVREKKGLERKQNIRDNLPPMELTALQLAEMMAADNIAKQNLNGNAQCEMACAQSARAIASAVNQAKKRLI